MNRLGIAIFAGLFVAVLSVESLAQEAQPATQTQPETQQETQESETKPASNTQQKSDKTQAEPAQNQEQTQQKSQQQNQQNTASQPSNQQQEEPTKAASEPPESQAQTPSKPSSQAASETPPTPPPTPPKEEPKLPEQPLDLTSKTPLVEEKEELKFVEWNGYYRLRWDLFHNLDLGVIKPLEAPCFSISGTPDKQCGDLFISANMRLMLNPTINISEDVRIVMRIDVLDNLVLGTTPDTLDYTMGSPNASGYPGFATTQLSPERGFNSFIDAVRIKALYGEVLLPIGMLRFGRVPSHFGAGIYINQGSGIDDDYGDFVDRIMFITKLFEHYLFVSWDVPNEGITTHGSAIPYGQDKDLTNLDDLTQWTFGFARKDKPETVEEKLLNGEFVLNYGLLNVIRKQDFEVPSTVTGVSHSYSTPSEISNIELVERNLFVYVLDAWAKFLWRDLKLEFEGVFLTGSLDNISPPGQPYEECDILQYGFVFKADYEFLDKMLLTGFEYGFASGDEDLGWGVYPVLSHRDYYSGGRQYESDGKITNFRFDPDYHVDLILFREMVRTVTDAMYFKFIGEYRPAKGLGTRLEMIYSRVLEPTSAPYYGDTTGASIEQIRNLIDSHDLGVELDVHLYYQSADKFRFALSYGILFPLGALGYVYVDSDSNTLVMEPADGVAQTVQFMLAIMF